MALLRGHWQLLLISGLIYALWNTDLVWPLKILVVLFHELSHAAAAILTGGSVVEISFHENQGGFARTQGGNRFWVASAGYLGSLVIGAGLFLSAVLMPVDRIVAGVLGVVMIAAAALYIRDVFPFLFTAGFGGVLIFLAWRLSAQFSDLALRVVGLSSMAYVPWDIVSDTIVSRPYSGIYASDAASIANQVGGTETLWGVIWLIISLVGIAGTFWMALRAPSNISFTGTARR